MDKLTMSAVNAVAAKLHTDPGLAREYAAARAAMGMRA